MTDLATILGPDRLKVLAIAAGGTRLFVPKHYGKPPGGGRDTSKRLAALVGEDIALLLVFHFGDSTIYVPTGRTGQVDPKAIKRLTRKGLSARAIATLVGCSERSVEKHRAKLRISQAKRRKDPRT